MKAADNAEALIIHPVHLVLGMYSNCNARVSQMLRRERQPRFKSTASLHKQSEWRLYLEIVKQAVPPHNLSIAYLQDFTSKTLRASYLAELRGKRKKDLNEKFSVFLFDDNDIRYVVTDEKRHSDARCLI